MTIFRFNLIQSDKLKYVFTSANDPDIISIEVMLDGNALIDFSMDSEGATSVLFGIDGGQMEFQVNDLRAVLDKCEIELALWREELSKPGKLWGESL